MEDIKVIWTSKEKNKFFTEIFEIPNGKKFKVRCDHSNGTSIGFNSHCCMDIMIPDGTWQHVTDNREVGFIWCNEDMLDDCDIRVRLMNQRASEKFKKFALKIWG